jgi:MoxR-like ATPase
MDRIPLPEPDLSYLRVDFEVEAGHADRVHLLSTAEVRAVNAAIAAGRPLLVRGEPGTGKSQLARAAAKQLGWAFVKHVIDSHTESRDLLWTFDAVRRLADAQIVGYLRRKPDQDDTQGAHQDPIDLAIEKYLHPGPLWWGFDWASAQEQCGLAHGVAPAQRDGGDWRKGCVFLLDEIDKAESEVPNGLLEALGAREFPVLGRSLPVRAAGRPVLVVITTNEERTLPDAFVRRCLVIRLDLPTDESELIGFLMHRGEAHFPQAEEKVLRKAAEMLLKDRQAAIATQILPRPGQAEYLDLLRVVVNLEPGDPDEQIAMMNAVADYLLKKQPGSDSSA